MKGKAYLWVSATLLGVVAVGHVVRAALQVPAQVGGAEIPVWLSWFGAVGAGLLSIWGFSTARKS